MPLLCPICKSPAQELDRTGDATGFYCTSHGHFKVADTIAVDEYYTRAEWEAALRAAKYEAMEGEWPVIRRGISSDSRCKAASSAPYSCRF
jgi:hypothetical protein